MKRIDLGLLVLRVGLGIMEAWCTAGPSSWAGPSRWKKLGAAVELVGIHFLPTFWGFCAWPRSSGAASCSCSGCSRARLPPSILITMCVASGRHLSRGEG
jgi:putative oxidoreductase